MKGGEVERFIYLNLTKLGRGRRLFVGDGVGR
jgi:hypothetical protein